MKSKIHEHLTCMLNIVSKTKRVAMLGLLMAPGLCIKAQTINKLIKWGPASSQVDARITEDGSSTTLENAHLTFSTTTGVINWGGGSGDLVFRRLATTGVWNTGFNTLMTIKYGGNVGIGVTNPAHKLHVDNGAVYVSGTNSFGGAMILLGGSASTPNQWGIESSATGLNFWRPWPAANAGNYFMFLRNSDGNVGINTDNPTAKLTVNGNVLIGDPAAVTLPGSYKLYVQTGILTEMVKVAVNGSVNWSDYVFDKEYKIRPLSEVEAYVTEHKHLPGIPSAEEVQRDGIDLGAMDAKLLEKIEELTLYVIKLEKEMNALKADQSK